MSPPRKPKKPKEPEGITKITVKGFKSLANETSIDIRPLTILAGANSSGKSSIMQPLLLLKQTLEVGYDPGALLLDGPNVRFTSADQLLTRVAGGAQSSELVVGIEVDGETAVTNVLSPAQDQSLALRQTTYSGPGLRAATFRSQPGVPQAATDRAGVRHGPFLVPRPEEGQSGDRLLAWGFAMLDRERFEERIRELIHLPGLRGNPERAYRTTA
ncbi:MAG: ATP-binding protein, partial [Armatimonadetes bacterium]|nr:ATP-binding protein [Armatimonadota bacterium]